MEFLFIFILCLIAGYILPWWFLIPIAFLTAYFFGKKGLQSFWIGFLAVFLAWIILALLKSVPNQHILVSRISHLLHLPHPILVFILTGLLGGLLGGLSALSGFSLKQDLTRKKT